MAGLIVEISFCLNLYYRQAARKQRWYCRAYKGRVARGERGERAKRREMKGKRKEQLANDGDRARVGKHVRPAVVLVGDNHGAGAPPSQHASGKKNRMRNIFFLRKTGEMKAFPCRSARNAGGANTCSPRPFIGSSGLCLPELAQAADRRPNCGGCSGVQRPCAASHGLRTRTALPDADSLSLDVVLAAEVTEVLGMCRGLQLLGDLSQVGTIACAVLANNTDLLGSLAHDGADSRTLRENCVFFFFFPSFLRLRIFEGAGPRFPQPPSTLPYLFPYLSP